MDEIAWSENRALVGTGVELLMGEGGGRKDGATARRSGRARDNRLVHVGASDALDGVRPGDVVTTAVTAAAPHHLISDGASLSIRRTAAGDAWESSLGRPARLVPGSPDPRPGAVVLGMPGPPGLPGPRSPRVATAPDVTCG